MNKTIKLKKNYEYKNTFKRGKYFSGNFIECFCVKNNRNINCFGIAISSKLCNAVKRNRIKRVIREAYRNNENNIITGNTFVFLWKKNIGIQKCNYKNVFFDMKKIFIKMDICANENNND